MEYKTGFARRFLERLDRVINVLTDELLYGCPLEQYEPFKQAMKKLADDQPKSADQVRLASVSRDFLEKIERGREAHLREKGLETACQNS